MVEGLKELYLSLHVLLAVRDLAQLALLHDLDRPPTTTMVLQLEGWVSGEGPHRTSYGLKGVPRKLLISSTSVPFIVIVKLLL